MNSAIESSLELLGAGANRKSRNCYNRIIRVKVGEILLTRVVIGNPENLKMRCYLNDNFSNSSNHLL